MRICKHCGIVVNHYRDNRNRMNRICEHGITSTVMASRCPNSKKPLATHSENRDEEAHQLATTCFHCGAPALPETHGLDPRCERHSDV